MVCLVVARALAYAVVVSESGGGAGHGEPREGALTEQPCAVDWLSEGLHSRATAAVGARCCREIEARSIIGLLLVVRVRALSLLVASPPLAEASRAENESESCAGSGINEAGAAGAASSSSGCIFNSHASAQARGAAEDAIGAAEHSDTRRTIGSLSFTRTVEISEKTGKEQDHGVAEIRTGRNLR